MGFWSALLVEADVETLRSKSNVELPARFVKREAGNSWLAFDVVPEVDEIGPDGVVGYPEPARLSDALQCKVCVLAGHTVVGLVQVVVYENGSCVRALEMSDEGWKVYGDGVQPWEKQLVTQSLDRADGEMVDEYIEASQVEAQVVEALELRHGARLPLVSQAELEVAVGAGILMYGGGEPVSVRERPNMGSRLRRLFGG